MELIFEWKETPIDGLVEIGELVDYDLPHTYPYYIDTTEHILHPQINDLIEFLRLPQISSCYSKHTSISWGTDYFHHDCHGTDQYLVLMLMIEKNNHDHCTRFAPCLSSGKISVLNYSPDELEEKKREHSKSDFLAVPFKLYLMDNRKVAHSGPKDIDRSIHRLVSRFNLRK